MELETNEIGSTSYHQLELHNETDLSIYLVLYLVLI